MYVYLQANGFVYFWRSKDEALSLAREGQANLK